MEHPCLHQNSSNTENNCYIANGFRLEQLEVYNWGTFNHHIWQVKPNSGTALLTGANGSGKSTLADALLTLFVPYNRRTYNQASGTEKHRERNESTYVRGAFSKQKDRDSSVARVEYLREKDSYSVLLALFVNAHQRQYVTLAQVFWWQQGELRKFHVVASAPLTIEQHFAVRGGIADLKKQLKASGAEVYEEFVKYSQRFCRLLGLRSEKALDLFNQIVSIKDIGGLNAFVRDHMLQKTDAEKRIIDLRENFENLTRAHAAIELAEQQLSVLEPLMNDVQEHEKLRERIVVAEQCAQVVPVYIASRKESLLEAALVETRQQRFAAQEQSDTLKQHIDYLGQQILDLEVARQNDSVGQRIANIKRDIQMLTDRQAVKKQQAAQYNLQVRAVNLPEYQDETIFTENVWQARSLLPQVAAHYAALTKQRDALKQQEVALVADVRLLGEELSSLQQRKSQIPTNDIRLRAALTQALGIPEENVPFVGELLRVRESARQWEPAIERLLLGFGRQLLVPEHHYQRISRYVDQTNLHGRIVYHRLRGPRTPRNTANLAHNLLFFKLEVKPDTEFTGWLAAELIDIWDYSCCERLEDFQQARRALTLNGQIKHNTARHEKNDSIPLGDRKHYVLGWSNVEKIAAIRRELLSQDKKLQELRNSIEQIEQRQKQEEQRTLALQRLLDFSTFSAIDWRSDERTRNTLLAQQRDLEASADHLTQLNKQVETISQQLKEQAQQHEQVLKTIGTLDGRITHYEQQQSACRTVLQETAHVDITPYIASIEKEQKNMTLTIENADEMRESMAQFYRGRASSLRGQLTPLNDRITKGMRNFKQISPDIAR
ncbi:MAG TPA: ATP-binding protein, partial [Ktedonobacteraceae bacterium]|nr:ATP-binding protein [Ktedonobacteraceae bacterium]